MFRIVLTAAALALLPLAATAAPPAPDSVIDLVADPSAMTGIVLPHLLDAVMVYPDESQKAHERGRVRLTFIVGTDGVVSDVKIVEPSQYWRLNDAAVSSMLQRSYAPATRGGVPVAVRIWSLDSFNPDPAAPEPAPLDAASDLNYSCRFGTHHIAVDACTALMASGKPAKELLYPRAHAYEQLGEYALAIADYDKLIGYRPDRADLYRSRGFSYEALGQYDRAIADYDHALKLDPKSVVYYFDRGFAHERLGQHDAALADFSAGMDHRPQCEKVSIRGIGADWTVAPGAEAPNNILAPADNPLHPALGSAPGGNVGGPQGPSPQHMTSSTSGESKQAVMTRAACTPSWVTALTDIAPIKPGEPDEIQHLEYRCWARAVWNKQLDAALADCDSAIALNPGFVRAYATRGWVEMRKGDYAAAIKGFNDALAKNPRLASALYVRGLAKLKTGDTAGGETDILTARTVDPEIASTYARYDTVPS